MVCFVVRGCLRAVLELSCGMFGDVWSSWLLLGFRMASPWPIFGNWVFTGRRHVKFSDFGRNLALFIYVYIYNVTMHSETGAHRASPWPIFGNRLSQGVAMANFRIWKSVWTGRRHGQFSETCLHRASPWQIFGFGP